MERLTIIFVPHERAKFRKISISLPALWLFLSGFFAVVVFSAYLLVQVFQARMHSTALHRLSTENLDLARKVAYYEGHLSDVERQMETIERKTRQLTLMSDLRTEGSDGGTGGVGGLETIPLSRVDSTLLWQSRLLRSLDWIADGQSRRAMEIASLPTISPVRGIPTTGFGMRIDPFSKRREFHPALDISSSRGEPVVAAADGLVVKAGFEGGYGKIIKLSHGSGFVTIYAHLSRSAVESGARVSKGEVIGFVGSTGRSTGPHLHYEVHRDGRAVDPTAFILDSL